MKQRHKINQTVLAWGLPFFLILASVGYGLAQTCIPASEGLVAWWPGDGNANDIKGMKHGTLKGGAGFAAGKVGQAFRFDGVDDYVKFSTGLGLETQSFSLDFRIKYEATGGLMTLFVWGASNAVTPSEAGFGTMITGAGQILWGLRDARGQINGRPILSTPAPAAGQFHHLAFVFDRSASVFKLHINAILAASSTIPAGFGSLNNNGRPAIGVHNRGGFGDVDAFYKGLLDEVTLYTRALSEDEILTVFTAGSAGKCKSAVPPVWNIQLNKTSFVNGDWVIAQVARLENPGPSSVPVEVKLWFDLPGSPPPVPFLSVGADGSFVLPAGFNRDFGPLPLATVQAAFPRGTYWFNCRLLHPVTKKLLTEDLHSFVIQ